MNKERKLKVEEKNYQPMYKLFMLECEGEPFPGEEGWRNNIPYTTWADKMNKRFLSEKGYPVDDPIICYIQERGDWVTEQLRKYD